MQISCLANIASYYPVTVGMFLLGKELLIHSFEDMLYQAIVSIYYANF